MFFECGYLWQDSLFLLSYTLLRLLHKVGIGAPNHLPLYVSLTVLLSILYHGRISSVGSGTALDCRAEGRGRDSGSKNNWEMAVPSPVGTRFVGDVKIASPISTFFFVGVACKRQTFLLAHRRWGTFHEKERLRLSDRYSILMTLINV